MGKNNMLPGNPQSWTSEDRERFKDFCESISFMEKVLEDNGYIIRRHALVFSGGKMTYKIHFGGCIPLETNVWPHV